MEGCICWVGPFGSMDGAREAWKAWQGKVSLSVSRLLKNLYASLFSRVDREIINRTLIKYPSSSCGAALYRDLRQ